MRVIDVWHRESPLEKGDRRLVTHLFAVTVHVYGFNGIYNPLNHPFLRRSTDAPPGGRLYEIPLRKGGKGVVILYVFRVG